ncbi:hypothetical protein HPB52_024740 [Rhipicephalus sanguineus]|uniref:G-protein coupled receptors family 1 profile domain-containing protein n=1 Tax=Rhipicephalus sanguineus TaxID=34632 RepID=A0A9D4TDW9_RHISA|nr:hypothetical protein HPB52_024740 [Rhipicephalus sanguineus]
MTSTNLPLPVGAVDQGVVGVDSVGSAAAVVAAAFYNFTADFVESSTRASGRQNMPSRRQRVGAASPSHPSVAIQVLDFLNAVYMPAVIYLGLVGNVLSLITFLLTKLKNRASSLYMGALAISDSGFLIILSFAWLNERGINVYQHGLCLVTVFFTSVFSCWSVWLTVSFTAERFVAVRYPLWKLQTSSPSRRPRLVIGTTAILSLALNAPLLLFVRVGDGEYSDCSLHPEYESRLNGNTVISKDGTITATSGGGIAHATQISVTRMLLLVSTVFMLLNLPSYVMRIYVFLLSLGHSDLPDAKHSSLPYVLQRYFMLLYYTNFAINFVLYNASSRMFRSTLCEYMQGRWHALRESMAGIRSSLGRSSTSQTKTSSFEQVLGNYFNEEH